MKLGIANDQVLAAEALRRIAVAGGHTVAWIARDGAAALRLCRDDPPELVLMDLSMPQLDGVEATRRIMQECPCAILIVTARPEDQPARVFRALGAGALDVTATPLLAGQPDDGAALLAKLRMIASLVRAPALPDSAHPAGGGIRRLIALGASTGGPAALAAVLAGWRPGPETALVAIQHIDAGFAAQFCQWLGQLLELPVRSVRQGDALTPGALHLCQSDQHLVLTPRLRLAYIDEPRATPYRPSVDVFFDSVARCWPAGQALGILLTGMGSDGAAGLLAMRRAGHQTWAQDAASCTVYGMPRAAAELGAAEKILSLEAIKKQLHLPHR